jgi:ADP-ribose pyrophosphatase
MKKPIPSSRSEEQRDRERKSLVDSRWAYQGRIVKLRLDTYQFGDAAKIAEIIHHPGAVVVVPIDEEGQILFVRQWRRAAKEIMIELPAGTLEESEPPEVCAKRELQEETGFAAREMRSLGGFFSAPGFCDEYLHLFLAEGLYSSPLPPDDDEGIDLVKASLKEAIRMIEENAIRDAKTVAGLFKYQLWKSRCENP